MQRSKGEVLAETPLFKNLLPAEINLISDLVSEREYRAGDVVFSEGDAGDALFIIMEGEVEVLRRNPDGDFRVLATLGAPAFFGEMSLIDKEFRSATVRAATDARLLQLTNENLHTFAKHFRNGFTWIVVNIARVMSSRLRETNRRLAEKL